MSIGYNEAIVDIKANRIKPLYLLFGDEEYLQEKWLKELSSVIIIESMRDFNYQLVDGSKLSAAQVISQANTPPVFADRRLLVIKNPDFIKTAKAEAAGADQLMEYITDPMESTCLVFWVSGSPDKRNRYYKAIDKMRALVDMPRLKGAELSRWIKEECNNLGISLKPDAMSVLLSLDSVELWFVHNELEKLALFYNGSIEAPVIVSLKQLLEVMTPIAETGIFELVDNIGQKKGEQSLEALRNILMTKEQPVRILFMIARQFRLIFQAKILLEQGLHERATAKELGVLPFVASKACRQSTNYNLFALEIAMKLLRDSDLALKSGANAEATLQELVLRLVSLN